MQTAKHTANILGVNVSLMRVEDVIERIGQIVAADQRAIITHTHVMGLNIAYDQAWFRQFLNQAELVYCDGMGVKLGARLLGYQIPQRFTLADWMDQFAASAEKQGYSFYFLGNPPEIAERAAGRLLEKYPRLRIAGCQHGFFNKAKGRPENEAVIAHINAVKPDVLLVGFGMPAQEKWVLENWDRLNIHIAMTVGAVFEYVAGDLPRGPHWMTDHYLEWLVRFFIAPGRYARRYLRDNPLFLYRLLRQKFFGILPVENTPK